MADYSGFQMELDLVKGMAKRKAFQMVVPSVKHLAAQMETD